MGRLHDVRYRCTEIDGRLPHFTTPFSGCRFSAVFFNRLDAAGEWGIGPSLLRQLGLAPITPLAVRPAIDLDVEMRLAQVAYQPARVDIRVKGIGQTDYGHFQCDGTWTLQMEQEAARAAGIPWASCRFLTKGKRIVPGHAFCHTQGEQRDFLIPSLMGGGKSTQEALIALIQDHGVPADQAPARATTLLSQLGGAAALGEALDPTKSDHFRWRALKKDRRQRRPPHYHKS